MNATITRFEYQLLKRLALVGIDWEIGNSIGVSDNPQAAEYVRLMNEAKRKIKAIKPRYRKTKTRSGEIRPERVGAKSR